MWRTKDKFTLVYFFFYCFLGISFSQNNSEGINAKDFKEFYKLYFVGKNYSIKKENVNKWIHLNKVKGNVVEVMTGYQVASGLYLDDNFDIIFKYCDSILSISEGNEKFNFYTSSAYVKKGNTSYSIRDYTSALEYYLLALKYANNDHNIYSINFSIGLLKDRIGNYNEALDLFEKTFSFSKKNYREKWANAYLSSMYGVANSYNNLRKLDSANFYNRLGIRESLILDEKNSYKFFVLNQGTTHYLKKEYVAAIDSLNKAARLFKEANNISNEAESYYYLAKAYDAMGFREKSISNFKRVDTIFRVSGDLFPTIRESYEYLIEYYKEEDNLEKQLEYVNQLIKLDSILHMNELSLNKSLMNNYDIPRLIRDKEKIIKLLKSKENTFLGFVYILILLLLLAILLLNYQFRKRKIYKRRFNEIVQFKSAKNDENASMFKKTSNAEINIPIQIIQNVLFQLEQFESENEYLSNDVTLQSLAKKIDTNSNYLSKIVNEYKTNSFSNYLNNLRVEYAIEKLRSDVTFRKYTIKAISEEVGFNNSESFAKAFFKSKRIRPSYFLKELKRELGE